jgi:hypothetical protein
MGGISRSLAVWAGVIGGSLAGCGSSAQRSFLDVGSDDGGAISLGAGGDGGGTSTLGAHIEDDHVAVTLITLGCEGSCADVEAVGTGGHPPYTFKWDDGSTSATQHVCPTADTSYSVTVTDTAASGEVVRAAQSATASVTADVVACPDGGSLDAGPRPPVDAGPTSTVTVPGTADVWLAGQPDGSMITCSCYPNTTADTAPAESPVEVPVVGGTTLTFSATGSTSNAPGICVASSPDGGCIGPLSTTGGPDNGLSSLAVPLNALIGVFLGPAVPSGQPPAALDASGSNAFTSLSPLLQQVFFIGDGLTGTGSGSVQQFVVPAGATRLFLGSSDGSGGNYNNTGQFEVVVTPL